MSSRDVLYSREGDKTYTPRYKNRQPTLKAIEMI